MTKAAAATAAKQAEKATAAISELEANLDSAEEKVREVSEKASELADQLGDDVMEKATDSIKGIETFIRTKPLQATAIAFGAGIIATMILRRKS